MSSIIILSLIAAGVWILSGSSSVRGMEDTPVSIENIRRGVKNGWYTCTLLVVDGVPAVRLTGKKADGKSYTGVYPISAEDWQQLKSEGYHVAQ